MSLKRDHGHEWVAQSITKKAVAIAKLISDRMFDVLAITETWRHTSDVASLRTTIPPCFTVAEAVRKNRTGGGVVVIYTSVLIDVLICLFSSFCTWWSISGAQSTGRA